ncbi:MAG: amino acid racemase [Bacteroidota bacterium]
MKSLGLIGGTSWHSTMEYYSYINSHVNAHFGDNTNPPLLVYTLNHAQIHQHQQSGNWDGITDMLVAAGQKLMQAGAEGLLLCANTLHKVYPVVQARLQVPVLHIGAATASAIQKKGLDKVGFLGTKFTMTEDFVTRKMTEQSIEVFLPTEPETIHALHRIIHAELVYGKLLPTSKTYLLEVISSLVQKGAQGVVLGCTEFPLIIQSADLDIPVFNSTKIHALAGAGFVLNI